MEQPIAPVRLSPEERVAIRAEVRAVWAEILDTVYPPGGMEHEEEYLRLAHADLAAMDTATLRDERARLRLRLMLEREPGPWYLDRLEAIETQLRAGHVGGE